MCCARTRLVPLAIYLQHTPLERFLVAIGRFTTFAALNAMMDEDIVNTAIVELQETSKSAEGSSAEFARLSITSLQEMRQHAPLKLVRVAEYYTHPIKARFCFDVVVYYFSLTALLVHLRCCRTRSF